jgi:hypothetical protein
MYELNGMQTSRTKTLLESFRRSKNIYSNPLEGFWNKIDSKVGSKSLLFAKSTSPNQQGAILNADKITSGKEQISSCRQFGETKCQEIKQLTLKNCKTSCGMLMNPVRSISTGEKLKSDIICSTPKNHLNSKIKMENHEHGNYSSDSFKPTTESTKTIRISNPVASVEFSSRVVGSIEPSTDYRKIDDNSGKSYKDLNEVFKSRRMMGGRDSLKDILRQADSNFPPTISNDVSMLLGMSVAERAQTRSKLHLAHDLKVSSFFKHFEERQKSRGLSRDLEKTQTLIPNHVESSGLLVSSRNNNPVLGESRLLQTTLARKISQLHTEASIANQGETSRTILSKIGIENHEPTSVRSQQAYSKGMTNLLSRRKEEQRQESLTARNPLGSNLECSKKNLLEMAQATKSRGYLRESAYQIIDSGLMFKVAATSNVSKELFTLPSGDSSARSSRAIKHRSQALSQLNSLYDAKDKEIQARSIERISRIRMKLTDNR